MNEPSRRAPARATLACLAAAAAAACGGEDVSPFPLWDMYLGMPIAELDSITYHDQGDRYACVPVHEFYRRCRLYSEGIRGDMHAVLDTLDRVVELVFEPDQIRMTGGQASELTREARRMAVEWSREVEPSTTESLVGYPDQAWTTEDGRWSAEMDWAGAVPSRIRTSDERAMVGYRFAESLSPSEPPPLPSTQTLPERPGAVVEKAPTRTQVSGELRRLVDAQVRYKRLYRRYAESPAQLSFQPRDGVQVRFGHADVAGFWASATTGSGVECRVWHGAAPRDLRRFHATEGFPRC